MSEYGFMNVTETYEITEEDMLAAFPYNDIEVKSLKAGKEPK